MTRLAKILIQLNLGLSILFAAWGLGIYTQQIDRTAAKAGPDKAPGELRVRLDEIEPLTKDLGLAHERWSTALHGQTGAQQLDRRGLLAVEAQRGQNEAWYRKQLADLQTGQGTVKGLVFANGVLQTAPLTGLPTVQDLTDKRGQPMPSAHTLSEQFLATKAEIDGELKKLDDLVKREKELTTDITGDAMKKGLRPLLAAEQLARRNAELEQDYLRPLRYNRQVEAELLQKRQQLLKARLQELGVGVAAAQP